MSHAQPGSFPPEFVAEVRQRLEAPDPRWHARAECRNLPTHMFYPDTHTSPKEIAKAKAVCASCEVKADCMAEAIRTDERFGLWGGCGATTRGELRRLLQGKPRPPVRIRVHEECGTVAGYEIHRQRNERVCDRCRKAFTADRRRNQCGTYRGRSLHQYHGEPICDRCRVAWNAYEVERRRRKREERENVA